ncbi:MAG: Asp23/Gls24 family envelope stress response protein [Ruminococcus sp.]|nr:Asp23/Gls24 family envelope stress response protein [Ruminococcus sp.]
MEVVKENLNSRLKVSDDVIITVTRLATLDVKGVAGLDGEINRLSKISRNPPITVGMVGDVASIDVRIKVKGTEKVRNIAENVQNAVKENVQNMTGLTVAKVNVTVNGAVFE